MGKRIFSMLLCVLLLCAAVPQLVAAETEYYFDASGNLVGTSDDGYVIDGFYYPYEVVPAFPSAPAPDLLPGGHVHSTLSPVRENVVSGSCTSSGSYDEVTYCALCGAELSRIRQVTSASHCWDANGVCASCGRQTFEGTYHVYPSDGVTKAVVYGRVPEGVSVKIEPAGVTAESFASLLPAEIRASDLLAGEFRVYDVFMQYDAGERYVPSYQLQITLNPGFERNELLHAYHIYDKVVDTLPDGTPVYATVAEELEPELDSEGIRMTFSAVVGERYAFYSEGELWDRVLKRLDSLPDVSSLQDDDTARALERRLVEIDELTAQLAASDPAVTYAKIFDGMAWDRYNQLRELVNAYFGYGVTEIESDPAEDGAVAVVSGDLPEGASVTLHALSLSDEDIVGYFGRTRSKGINAYVAYDITILVDGEEWQPDESVSVSIRQPDLVLAEGAAFAVAHVDQETEKASKVADAELTEEGAAEFVAESFSVYILYYFTEIESAPAEDGAVAVVSGDLPAGASVELRSLALSEEEIAGYFGTTRAEAINAYAAYDITILVDGEQWQPDDSVAVSIRRPDLALAEGEAFAVAHVDAETDQISTVSGAELTAEGDAEFIAESFSVYILYTVDFHFGDMVFSIEGMSSILLSELFEALEIDIDAAEVTGLVFSNPGLLRVEQLEHDWLLTSLEPFDTEEFLTVTLADGMVFDILVTDALGGLWDYSTPAARAEIQILSGKFNEDLVPGSLKDWTGSTVTRNAPAGYTYIKSTKGASNSAGKIIYNGQTYYLFLSCQSDNFTGNIRNTNNSPLPCINYDKVVVAWIEDEEGNKVILDNVCVGNRGESNLWNWKFGGDGRKTIYTNGSVTLSTYGSIVSSSGIFQGILPDANGYYTIYMGRNRTGGSGDKDEVMVFELTSIVKVTKYIDGDNKPFAFNYTTGSHSYDFNLSNAESHSFEPVFGSTNIVSETLDPDYDLTKIELKKNGSVTRTINTPSTPQISLSDAELADGCEVVFYNHTNKVGLRVRKQLANDTDGTFNFTAHFTSGGQPFVPDPLPEGATYDAAAGNINFSLTVENGSIPSIFFHGLPLGASYTVQEINHTGYSVQHQKGTGSVQSGDTATGTLTDNNTLETFINTDTNVRLTVKKQLNTDTEGIFNFSAQFTSNGQAYVPSPLPAGATYDAATGKINFSLTVGNGNTPEMVFRVPSGTNYTVQELNHGAYDVEHKRDDAWRATSGDTAAANNLTADHTETFTNTPINGHGIRIIKQVKGAGDKSKNFNFIVTSTARLASDPAYLLTDNYTATFTLSNDDSVFLKLNSATGESTFSIREENADGYTVSARVVNGSELQGPPFSFTLSSSRNSSAAIIVTNNKEIIPDTGVLLDSLPYVIILAVVAGAAVVLLLKKRRREDD